MRALNLLAVIFTMTFAIVAMLKDEWAIAATFLGWAILNHLEATRRDR